MFHSGHIGGIILHLLFLVLPFILGLIYIQQKKPKDKVELYLLFYLVISVGLQGILAGICQIYAAHKSALIPMDWHYNPFLVELGMANLAFAVLGILSIWYKEQWRAATALGFAVFMLLSGIGHLFHMSFHAAGVGMMVWMDILLALVFFVLLRLRRKA